MFCRSFFLLFPLFADIATMSSNNKTLRQTVLSIHGLNPSWKAARIAEFMLKSENPPKKKRDVLRKFISRTIERGTVEDKPRTGRPRQVRNKAFVRSVKRLVKGKKGKSIRGTAAKLKNRGVNCSRQSVWNALRKDLKLKPWKRRKSQRFTAEHKRNRVESFEKLLKKFGKKPKANNSKWRRVVITDFSSVIRLDRPKNSKNDIIWETSPSAIKDDVRSSGRQKYSQGIMFWGGICAHGMVPKNRPINFSEWLKKKCAEIGKAKITMDNKIYASFLEEKVKPTLIKDYPRVNFIWQDDPDKKHRTQHVLAKVNELFDERIEPEDQAVKCADIYPIENVWGIIYEKLRAKDTKSLQVMKAEVNKIWRNITKQTCAKLIEEIPLRMQAGIDKKGEQVFKGEY